MGVTEPAKDGFGNDVAPHQVDEVSLPRILLVDDEEAFAYSVARALGAAGFEVVVAPDYRAALPILEDKLPLDLMISDVVMPDRVNGFALARAWAACGARI